MKLPTSVWIGAAAVIAAAVLYAGPVRWFETRKFIPLDIPVSVTSGHIYSGDFEINLTESYDVAVHLRDAEANYVPGCAYNAVPNARWTLFKNGKPVPAIHDSEVAASITSTYVLEGFDYFHATPGAYALDVEVHPPPACLVGAHPRLIVLTSSYDYEFRYEVAYTLFLFLGGIGFVLLTRPVFASARGRFANQHRNRVRIFQSLGYQYHFTPRKRRPLPSMFRMPDFGYFFMVAMFPALFLYMILRLDKLPYMGIKVRVSSQNGIYMNVQPRTKPLLVWLDAAGNYFVNEKKVPRNELGNVLNHELSQRAEWTVYFEADGNAYFGDAAFAMNEIQIASGKLVWLTPKTRSEFSSLKPAP